LTAVAGYAAYVLSIQLSSSNLTSISAYFNVKQNIDNIPLGVMSPITALMIISTCVILMLRQYEDYHKTLLFKISTSITIINITLCYIIILSYILGVPIFYTVEIVPVAFPSAISFLLINLTIQQMIGKQTRDAQKVKLSDNGALPSNKNRRRNTIITFAVMALVITLFGSLFIKNSFITTKEAAIKNIKNIGDLVSEQISDWYKERLAHAQIVQQSSLIQSGAINVLNGTSTATERFQLLEWMQNRKKWYGYDRFSLYDKTGKEVLGAPDISNVPETQYDKNFQKAILKDRIFITDLHNDERYGPFQNAHIHMNIWIPAVLPGKQGKATGVWLAQVDPKDYLYPLIQKWSSFSNTGETALVRREKNDIVFINELRHRKNTALKLKLNIQEHPNAPGVMATEGIKGVVEGIDYRGTPVLAAIGSIPGTPWFALVKIDKDEVYHLLRVKIWVTWCFVLILIALVAMGVELRERNIDRIWYKQQLGIEQERQKAELAFAASELRYRNMLDDLLEGCQVIDTDFKYIYLNDEAIKQNKMNRKELIGRTMMECFPGIEHTEMFKLLKICMTKHIPQSMENELTFEYGTVGWFNLRFQPVDNNVIILSSDITERKLAELSIKKMNEDLEQTVAHRTAQLQNAYQEMECFSYSVSHDLRSPLLAIEGFSRILTEDYCAKLDQEALLLLSKINKNTYYMEALIDDVLNLSLIDRKTITLKEIELKPLIEKVVSHTAISDIPRAANIVIEAEGTLTADQTMLEIALTNVISNAWKYTSRKEVTYIRISTKTEANTLTIAVKDNGAGFDVEKADKLFVPFQRFHNAEEFPGTGIGLSIVKRIMQKHGGTVSIESKPEIGTTVYLSFDTSTPSYNGAFLHR
jgi:PAS domain S-box-containing protein